ncbi:MAG: choloylglycine hydrolase [Lachnospiraceae bacterium]|jgi:penicillin V acylase-like amidase (Ntn superfamily)
MCTVVVFRKQNSYFGRNMDIDAPFGEKIILMPRRYAFSLKSDPDWHTRYAMQGMGAAVGGCPLYAEAVNEKGLAGAGLNFPGTARYHDAAAGKSNIAPYELIPWILSEASTVDEAEKLLTNVNLIRVPFAANLPLAPLHFIFSDARRSIVAEPMEDGLHVYDNPFDVLTNNPPFPFHLWNMRQYRRLSAANGEASLDGFDADFEPLKPFAEGMGAIGLPGDLSSASRFVRAAFTLAEAAGGDEEKNITQVFHILDSVAMTEGTVVTEAGRKDITRYSCCMNLSDGSYFYKTYGNSQISRVPMNEEAVTGTALRVLEPRTRQNIFEQK